jgi:hypothetical protein
VRFFNRNAVAEKRDWLGWRIDSHGSVAGHQCDVVGLYYAETENNQIACMFLPLAL